MQRPLIIGPRDQNLRQIGEISLWPLLVSEGGLDAHVDELSQVLCLILARFSKGDESAAFIDRHSHIGSHDYCLGAMAAGGKGLRTVAGHNKHR